MRPQARVELCLEEARRPGQKKTRERERERERRGRWGIEAFGLDTPSSLFFRLRSDPL
jgi:hypothetical protein